MATFPDPGLLDGSLAALVQVLIIDLALAGDNAVAVGMVAAGVDPRQRRRVIFVGLSVAVVRMLGLAIVLYVALHMMWEGHRAVAIDLGEVEAYNTAVPGLDITADEVRAHRKGR